MVAFCDKRSISDCEVVLAVDDDRWNMAKISQLRYCFARRSLMHSSSRGDAYRDDDDDDDNAALFAFTPTDEFAWGFPGITSTVVFLLTEFSLVGEVWDIFMFMKLLRGVFSLENALMALFGTVLLILLMLLTVELEAPPVRLLGEEFFMRLTVLVLGIFIN